MLNGGVAALFGKAFAGLYLPATLNRRVMSYDGDGNPTAATTAYTCRAQLDSVTETMRQSAGYTEGDVAIYILSHGLPVPVTTDDEIAVKGALYSIASADTDPANAYWLCRGQLVAGAATGPYPLATAPEWAGVTW